MSNGLLTRNNFRLAGHPAKSADNRSWNSWTARRGDASSLAAIGIDYFSWSRTTSDVSWARVTARVFPSGDH